MNRRLFLVSSAWIAVQLSLGLVVPRRVVARWPEDAFRANELDQAVAALTGNATVKSSSYISIQAQVHAKKGIRYC